MKTNVSAGLLFAACLLFSTAQAKLPVQLLTPKSVGVEYHFGIREQAITDAQVMSQETFHLISVYYAPVSWIQVSLGLGGEQYTVSEFSGRAFDGGYGLTPAAGLYLATPAVLKERVRLVADCEAVYLNSSDAHDYRYSGPVLDPSAGLLFHIVPQVNFEAGARWHIINGSMKSSEAGSSEPFSNNSYLRGYAELSAVSPSGVFLQADFAASSAAASDRFQNGLEEAALGFRIGLMLMADEKNKPVENRTNRYFPDYSKLKKRQKDMAEELK